MFDVALELGDTGTRIDFADKGLGLLGTLPAKLSNIPSLLEPCSESSLSLSSRMGLLSTGIISEIFFSGVETTFMLFNGDVTSLNGLPLSGLGISISVVF